MRKAMSAEEVLIVVSLLAERPRLPPAVKPPRPEKFCGPPIHAGRNDPCPCGSGKKFKRCHLREGEDRGRE